MNRRVVISGSVLNRRGSNPRKTRVPVRYAIVKRRNATTTSGTRNLAVENAFPVARTAASHFAPLRWHNMLALRGFDPRVFRCFSSKRRWKLASISIFNLHHPVHRFSSLSVSSLARPCPVFHVHETQSPDEHSKLYPSVCRIVFKVSPYLGNFATLNFTFSFRSRLPQMYTPWGGENVFEQFRGIDWTITL